MTDTRRRFQAEAPPHLDAAFYFAPWASNPVTVVIKDFDVAPIDVTIPPGGSMTWTNRDGEAHPVTSVDGLFRSGALDQDQSFTFSFARPGTYAYLCSIHPKMRATVTVR